MKIKKKFITNIKKDLILIVLIVLWIIINKTPLLKDNLIITVIIDAILLAFTYIYAICSLIFFFKPLETDSESQRARKKMIGIIIIASTLIISSLMIYFFILRK